MTKKVDVNLRITVDVNGSGKIGTNSSTQIDVGKIETDMSVAQLAYFCRILHDLGYFTNKNQTEMLKVATEKL